jgi:hypothetical protein
VGTGFVMSGEWAQATKMNLYACPWVHLNYDNLT